jgi:hypothetical protein
MTTLDTLQRVFQDYLMHPDNNHIETFTAEEKALPKADQLAIYYNAYRLRLLDILAEDYPKLQLFMSNEAFDECIILYIDAYPSRNFSVRNFGQHLNTFLRDTPPYADSPYLSELATFEWALNDTLDASDAEIFQLETLQTIPAEKWGDLQFTFHPSLQIMHFEWDTVKLWQAIKPAKDSTCDLENLIPPKLTTSVTWIAWRNDLQSQYRSLTELQATMLQILKENQNFAELCEQLCEWVEEEQVPQTALAFIQQCIQDKIISRVFY